MKKIYCSYEKIDCSNRINSEWRVQNLQSLLLTFWGL